MPNLYKFKVYCSTDSQWEYEWSETAPIVCPVNAGHTIISSSISVNEKDKLKIKTIDSTDSPYKQKKESLYLDTSGGSITVNLMKAQKGRKRIYYLKKTSASNTVTLDAHESELIDGQLTKTMTALDEILILSSDGTTWTTYAESTVLAIETVVQEDIDITGTKGELLVDNGDELGILDPGADGQVLTMDSTVDLGIKWSGPVTSSYIELWTTAGSTATSITTTYAEFGLSATRSVAKSTDWALGTAGWPRVVYSGAATQRYLCIANMSIDSDTSSNEFFVAFSINSTVQAQEALGSVITSGKTAEVTLTATFDISTNDEMSIYVKDSGGSSTATLVRIDFVVHSLQGPQGPVGGTGPTGPQGSKGMIWQTAGWVTSTAYTVDDTLAHNGTTYICISGHTSGASDEPGVGGSWATYWDVAASKGDQGIQGVQGNVGSGTNIIVQDEGTNVVNTPHDKLNFVGGGVVVTDGGSGVATVTITSEPACYGFYYMENNATGTTVTTASTLYKVAGTTTAGLLQGFTHADNKLTYTGTATKEFLLIAVATLKCDLNDEDCGIVFFKNGSQIGALTTGNAHATKLENASDTKIVQLSTNDYIELYTTNHSTSSTTMTIEDLNVSIICLGGQGGKGDQGDKGATWIGAWVTSTSYSVDDLVSNGGSSYICISAHTSASGDEPGVGGSWATYWDLIAQKGNTGAGSTLIIKEEGTTVTGGPHDTINFVGGGVTATDGGAGVATVTIASVFGSEYQYTEDLTLSTTTATTWQQKLRMTTASLPSGDYKLSWSCDFSNILGDKGVEVQLEQNDTTQISNNVSIDKLDGSTYTRHSFTGFKKLNLSGVNTFDIDYKIVASGTAEIKNVCIEIFRVT